RPGQAGAQVEPAEERLTTGGTGRGLRAGPGLERDLHACSLTRHLKMFRPRSLRENQTFTLARPGLISKCSAPARLAKTRHARLLALASSQMFGPRSLRENQICTLARSGLTGCSVRAVQLSEIMTPGVVTSLPDAASVTVAGQMRDHRVGSVVIVDQ